MAHSTCRCYNNPNCALLFGGICIQRLKVETCGRGVKLPRHRHPENCPDSLTLGDFARRPTRSFKPLHKICDFDLMLDAHIRDGHLHKAEPFLDAFHPFVFAQRSEPPRTVSWL